MNKQTAIHAAVKAVGNQPKLAAALGVSKQAVNYWVRTGTCPAKQAIPIERATGGVVTRQQLRPDLYPEDAT